MAQGKQVKTASKVEVQTTADQQVLHTIEGMRTITASDIVSAKIVRYELQLDEIRAKLDSQRSDLNKQISDIVKTMSEKAIKAVRGQYIDYNNNLVDVKYVVEDKNVLTFDRTNGKFNVEVEMQVRSASPNANVKMSYGSNHASVTVTHTGFQTDGLTELQNVTSQLEGVMAKIGDVQRELASLSKRERQLKAQLTERVADELGIGYAFENGTEILALPASLQDL